jgi:hypothetical protein
MGHINRSQIYEYRNWERGRGAASYLGIYVSNFRYSVIKAYLAISRFRQQFCSDRTFLKT